MTARNDRDAHDLLERGISRPASTMPRGRNRPMVGGWARAMYIGLSLLVLLVVLGGVLALLFGGRR